MYFKDRQCFFASSVSIRKCVANRYRLVICDVPNVKTVRSFAL
jgi:hypothetical protein